MKLSYSQFLEKEIEFGITPDHPPYYNLMAATADLVQRYADGLVLEIGAGVGTLGQILTQRGVAYYGIDPSLPHRQFAAARGVTLHDIGTYPKKASMVVAIEVFEHCTDEQIHAYLSSLEATYFLFSSTSVRTDFDEMWGHINVKDQLDWEQLFKTYGWRVANRPACPTAWTIIFKHDRQLHFSQLPA